MEHTPKDIPANKDDELYKDGFELGRYYAEFKPEVIKALANIDANSPVLEGVRAGQVAFDQERNDREQDPNRNWFRDTQITKGFNVEVTKSLDKSNKDLDPDR